MDEKPEKRTASIGIRVLPAVKMAIAAAAKAERRSAASYIETVLIDRLEADGFLPKDAASRGT